MFVVVAQRRNVQSFALNVPSAKTADDRSESATTSRSRCSSAPAATRTWCVPTTTVATPPEPIRSALPLRTLTSARSVTATYQHK